MNAQKAIRSFKNTNRISIKQLAADYGFDTVSDFLMAECQDSVMPACCKHECRVEPDGRCEHGCPSPLLALGII